MQLFVREKKFYQLLIRLAIPITMQNFITYMVALADNLMVGRLGESAISGVYMGNQIQTFLQFIVAGIESTVLILSTQYWGKNDTNSIKRIIGIALRFSLGIGVVFTVITAVFPVEILRLFTKDEMVIKEGLKYIKVLCWSYLFFCISQLLIAAMRSVEQARIGFYISLSAMIINISLNYILIFGKLGFEPMGVKGAAIATLIARIFEMLYIAVYVFLFDQKLYLKVMDLLKGNKALTQDLIKYGIPVLMGQIVWSVNTLAQSAIIGHMGADATTAVSIAGMLNNFLFMGIFGLSAALGILTGKTIGEGKYEIMKQYAITAQVIFLILGLASGVIIMVLMNPFISLYNINERTVFVAKQFIVVLAIAAVGRSYQATCLAGLVKAGGDVNFVFINDTIFVFFVVLPSALLAMFVFKAPAWVVYACLQSDQILKCFVAVVKINRFKWMKNLTRFNQGIE